MFSGLQLASGTNCMDFLLPNVSSKYTYAYLHYPPAKYGRGHGGAHDYASGNMKLFNLYFHCLKIVRNTIKIY